MVSLSEYLNNPSLRYISEQRKRLSFSSPSDIIAFIRHFKLMAGWLNAVIYGINKAKIIEASQFFFLCTNNKLRGISPETLAQSRNGPQQSSPLLMVHPPNGTGKMCSLGIIISRRMWLVASEALSSTSEQSGLDIQALTLHYNPLSS